MALGDRLKEPVAAVYLCLMEDGRVLEDPSTSLGEGGKNGVLCELLYAGTKDAVVGMEFSGKVEEAKVMELIEMAHDWIRPKIEIQREVNSKTEEKAAADESDADEEIRKLLGLDQIATEEPRGNSSIDSEKDLGETAAKMLIDRVESEDDDDASYRTTILEPTLIERDSTIG